MPTRLLFCTLLGGLLFLNACRTDNEWDTSSPPYEPVYNADPTTKLIRFQPPRTTVNGGNLYTAGNYVLEEEKDSGLHVISYQDAANPKKVAFISIPGFRAAAIKGDYLYVSNYDDLVTIHLDSFNNLQEASRLSKAWHLKDYPPFVGVLFVCADTTKGTIMSWRLNENIPGTSAKCRRQ
ncbi:hypothetical protein [Chitinophaga sp.]|uniref:hypothetical protein n=1 Tax=Chitinophaga sp. TaxID=1869181 RepID=UPI0031DB5688